MFVCRASGVHIYSRTQIPSFLRGKNEEEEKNTKPKTSSKDWEKHTYDTVVEKSIFLAIQRLKKIDKMNDPEKMHTFDFVSTKTLKRDENREEKKQHSIEPNAINGIGVTSEFPEEKKNTTHKSDIN